MIDDAWIAKIEAVIAKATSGPWIYERNTWDLIPRIENEDGDRKELWWTDNDDRFTCAARTAVPEAIAEVKRLRSIIDIMAMAIEERRQTAQAALDHAKDSDDGWGKTRYEGAVTFLESLQVTIAEQIPGDAAPAEAKD